MLKVDKLTKEYNKGVKAVDEVSFNIKKGEIFGFIGPNGAGKSTTIRTILKYIEKTVGEIYINNTKNYDNYIKESIGYLSGEVYLYDDLTVLEMIKYNNSFYKEDYMERGLEIANRLKLDLDKNIDELSLGNKKKIAIVLALMHNPKFLILDEPTGGLDPLMQEEFFNILKEEKKKDVTIFFSSHILNEVKKICDRVAIIKEGKIIKIENVETLTKTDVNVITIVSEELDKFILDEQITIKSKSDSSIKFLYNGNINDLINKLSLIKIDELLIEEPSIEEVFMHYYV